MLLTTIGVVGATAPAAFAASTPLPTALVTQQAGTVTGDFSAGSPGGIGVNFVNDALTRAWPAAQGDTVHVTFAAVKDTSAALVISGSGLLATFCGNFSGTTPLVGADVSSFAGVQANCEDLAAVTTTVTADGAGNVTANLLLDNLPAGVTCGTGGVLPCLLIVSNLTQTVSLAMPVANITATSVQGPASLYPATCNGSAAPPAGCPSGRVSTLATFSTHALIYGGLGFIPSSNNFAPSVPGTYVAGRNVTAVTQTVCNDSLGTVCNAGTLGIPSLDVSSAPSLFSVLTAAGDPTCTPASCGSGTVAPVGVSASGQLGGAIVITGGGLGNKFLKTTAQHLVVVPAAAVTCPAGFTDISVAFGPLPGLTGTIICSLTQTQYAQIRVLGTAATVLSGGSPVAPISATNPIIPNTPQTLDGHDFDARSAVTLQLLDPANNNLGAATALTTDGIGAFTNAFAAGALDQPANKLKITGVQDGLPVTFTIDLSALQDPSYCANADACSAGDIITAAVAPGNVELWTQDAAVDIAAVDLSTIDVRDDTSWYPLSASSAVPQVIIGDMRGQNAGFTVTASSSDLIGSIPANIIPKMDVYIDGDTVCDVYASAGDNNDPLGVVTSDTGSTPDSSAGSALQDGSQTLCTVGPDANGRAAGMFQLDFSVLVAGRPITAVDAYTGLLTLTITGG